MSQLHPLPQSSPCSPMESFALSTPTSFSLSTSRTSFLRHRYRPMSEAHLSLSLNPNFSSIPSLTSTVSHFSLFPSKSSSIFNPLSNSRIANHPIQASSSSSSAELSSYSPPVAQGAKPLPFFISISIGLIVRFLVPKPDQVTPQAWQLLSIFLSTIAGLVLSPLPGGAWAFLGLTTSIVTKTLSFSAAFSAFTDQVIWMIVISFFLARGFVKTGLGDRIAAYFVKWFGKSSLGLSYGLTFSEVLVALAMPSSAARAGGIFLPIIKSLALSAGSEPNHPSSRKLGSYLMQTQLLSAGNSSSLFLTAAGHNLLCLKLAEELGVIIANPWVTWFKAASLPALVSLLATPLILYKLYPPQSKDTPEAPAMAAGKLESMGPVTQNEWIMIGTVMLTVSLWIFGGTISIPSTVASTIGLSMLLVLGVLDWKDCLNEKSAWDALTWFSILVGMAGQLTNLGIIGWMSTCVANSLQSFSLSWPAALLVLLASYFFIHYIFASQIGHVGALYSAFLTMNRAAGVPVVLAALALGYVTNLFGSITHYSCGPAAMYYGAGYVDLPDLFKIGFIMAIFNAIIWGGVGSLWWKFLCLY